MRGRFALHDSVDLVPGWLSLTRVHNTGAAFGMLNDVDFPFKTVVLLLVALGALGRRGLVRRRACRPRTASPGSASPRVLGGAIGNLIDRATAGYVLDFVDVYWRDWHFWAFNVADAAITVGVVLMLADVVGRLPGVSPCTQSCLTPVRSPSTATACCSPPPTCSGCGSGVRRASAAGLDGNRVLDLGIWVIIAALVGAKGLLFVVDFEHFTSSREEFFSLLRSGGVFYGGLIAASLTCIYQLRKHKLPLWQSGDLFAPGIALGYMVGRLGCLMAGCCYGKPTQVAWAITFTDPAAAMNVGTPLGVPLHPTQLYESLAGLVILVVLLATERRGTPYDGPHVLAVRPALRRLALRRSSSSAATTAAWPGCSRRRSSSRSCWCRSALVMLWWLASRSTPSQPATAAVRRRPKSASA